MPHILLHAVGPSWGHSKPLTSFMLLLAESREDVVVTFLTDSLYTQIVRELSKAPRERLQKVEGRVNVINIKGPKLGFLDTPEFAVVLQELWKGNGSVTCVSSEKVFTNLPRPDLVILDPVAGYANLEAIRKLATRQELPVWTWFTSTIGYTVREWGPRYLGGKGDDWKDIAAINNEEEISARGKLLNQKREKLISIPGYPPMYHHELFPQEQIFDIPVGAYTVVYKYIQETEGYISVTTSVLEKEATDAWKEYLRSLGKEFYEVGFVSSTLAVSERKDNDQSDVMGFLDKMACEYGENSVIYISFGSVWWPSNPEKLYAIIDELIKSNTPFLLANPKSPLPSVAPIPEGILAEIKECGFGYATAWAPQEDVLRHPATGWFLSHGGWNGLQEALVYRVPPIFWPLSGDQPLNAALVSVQHQAAFELISARGGEGAQRPARYVDDQHDPDFSIDAVRDEFKMVLEKMKGKEGETIRRNFDNLATEVGKLWNDGGLSRRELDLFVRRHVPTTK
ncbi:hypothetical protein PM082_010238 [Marasmius tenuissimus]|nr:hypothetical protein PM082_010238 [Marasmius tenuissimus]